MSSDLKGMDSADYRINRVLMVGADMGDHAFLGPNDSPLLKSAVSLLTNAGLNFSDEIIRAANDPDFHPSDNSVAILNIRRDMGGRDFLDMREKGDLVIFCNIPRDENSEHSQFSQSFALSANHEVKGIWGQALDFTDAKAVVVHGGIECLNESEYVGNNHVIVHMTPYSSSWRGDTVRTMISKSILSEGEAYFDRNGAPLRDTCIEYEMTEKPVLNLRVLHEARAQGHRPVGPNLG